MGYSQLGTMGIVACEAAYNYGEVWFEAVLRYINANIEFVQEFLAQHLPEVKLKRPEGTYLIWLDFRGLGLSEQELTDLIDRKALLWVDHGNIFGAVGNGFERINVACPRQTLVEALTRLEHALKA